jgi:mono/diheme cytochrome c family protein
MQRIVSEGGSWRWRTVVLLAGILLLLGWVQQSDAQSTRPVGDSSIGKELFEGTIRFENGGPPCLACHSVAGIGALGGGALGPDLTNAYANFGGDAIDAILATTPFATMQPIFDEQPLTSQEQAHLAAFLEQAPLTERTAATVGQLALLGMAGATILLLLVRFIWSRRVIDVRKPMLARSRARIERSKLARGEPQNTTLETESR